MFRNRLAWLVFSLVFLLVALPSTIGQQQRDPAQKRETQRKEDPQQRAKALRAICDSLSVGAGSVIADIGAGNGRDSWTFASIVGESGKVLAEEIEESKCQGIEKEAGNRDLTQVEAVLGTDSSPKLPANAVDMAFMHHVYHHFSKPREMLRGIWQSLKPGGYLVIVDQRLGTLVDWVPREERDGKHFWIAETTVVREARETGYLFVDFAEPLWHTRDSFVLIFQRAPSLATPDRDPDTLSEIPNSVLAQLLPPEGRTYRRVAFVALGEGRKLIGPLLEAMPCAAVDIVLEEWATQKEERPALPSNVTLPSVLTEKGDPKLGPEPIDAVFFLDGYHLLFHGPTLLAQLRERLSDDGQIFVLDRASAKDMTHREASHRRMVPPRLVQQEMEEAGFALLREAPTPAADRFLLVFGRAPESQ